MSNNQVKQDKDMPKLWHPAAVGSLLAVPIAAASFAIGAGIYSLTHHSSAVFTQEENSASAALTKEAEQRRQEAEAQVRAVVNCYHQPPADPALCPLK